MVCKPEILNIANYLFPNATIMELDNTATKNINIKQSLKDTEKVLWDVRLQMVEGLKTTDVTKRVFLEANILKISEIINEVCEIEKEFEYTEK